MSKDEAMEHAISLVLKYMTVDFHYMTSKEQRSLVNTLEEIKELIDNY